MVYLPKEIYMKKVFNVLVVFALLFGFCIPAFSQVNSMSMTSAKIDDFDTEPEDWKWTVNASRFISEGYPKFKYFDGIADALRSFHEGENDPKVFGVKVAFDRKGDNWFEILPSNDDGPYEIPLKGHVSTLDFWVWGANYLYFLEVMVRDANGVVHVLPAGSLTFNGWKNIIIKIPGWMQQKSKLRSGPKNLTFLGFRVRTDGSEYVDDFVIYFDNIKYMTNPIPIIFDGYEFLDMDFSDAETGGGAGSDANDAETSSADSSEEVN